MCVCVLLVYEYILVNMLFSYLHPGTIVNVSSVNGVRAVSKMTSELKNYNNCMHIKVCVFPSIILMICVEHDSFIIFDKFYLKNVL